jgi:Tfp pilus assembly protein PilP
MSRPSSRVAVAFLLAFSQVAGLSAANAQSPAPGAASAPAPAATAQPAAQAPVAAPGGAPGGAAAQAAPAPGGLQVPCSEFRYDPTGMRDPFKSLLQLEKKQRDTTQLPPIQQFDLDTVKVVGIVVDPAKGTQAMVKAPNGQTFVVRVGTIIGKNEGEIVEITLQGIRILEKFVDFMNRETRKETFLRSHPAAGK